MYILNNVYYKTQAREMARFKLQEDLAQQVREKEVKRQYVYVRTFFCFFFFY